MKAVLALFITVSVLSGCAKDAPKDEFQGFRLGERYKDILYRKGNPTAARGNVTLNYGHDDLLFKNGSLFLIDHTCQKDDKTTLVKVTCGTQDNLVKEKLGNDYLYLCNPASDFVRVIASPNRGVYFMLYEAKVTSIGLSDFTVPYDPEFNYRGYAPNDSRWVPCS